MLSALQAIHTIQFLSVHGEAPKLTAKVGTLKRKQQLRDIMENANEGYADNVFDSTPFRKYSGAKVSHVHVILYLE